MVGLLRPRTVYLKSNECALFSVSLRCDFSVSSSPYCTCNDRGGEGRGGGGVGYPAKPCY